MRTRTLRIVAAAAAVVVVATVAVAVGARDSDDDVTRLAGDDAVAAPEVAVPDDLAELLAMPVERLDGGTVRLADYAGRPVVVNFWASWCASCIAEMPDFESVSRALDGTVAFVGVNVNDRIDDARTLADRTGVTYDLVRDPDGRLAERFGVVVMPTTVVLDATGAVIDVHGGALDVAGLEALIEPVVGDAA